MFRFQRNMRYLGQKKSVLFNLTVLLPERFTDALPSAYTFGTLFGILQRAIQIQSRLFQTPESITPSVGISPLSCILPLAQYAINAFHYSTDFSFVNPFVADICVFIVYTYSIPAVSIINFTLPFSFSFCPSKAL